MLTDDQWRPAQSALGYFLRLFGFSVAPLLLGFVLGPLMEEHFRRAMLISRGDLSVYMTRPISATLIAITLALITWAIIRQVRGSSIYKAAP